MGKKICISTTSFAEYDDSYLERCRKKGFEIVLNPHGRKVSADELVVLAKDAEGLIAGTEPITEKVLLKLPKLKVISRCGAGIENVDAEAMNRLGLKLFSTPDAPTLSVAELTIGLMLNLLRKINVMDKDVKSGGWNKLMGNLLAKKNIGIIGFGRIGKKVAELVNAFQCRIVYYDPHIKEKVGDYKSTSLSELLKCSEIVSIHAATEERLLGKKELSLMKQGSFLVNVSRGEVIDEKALYESLINGHLSGAALDVFEEEPYNGPLKRLDNVILTPHIGSYSKEARISMEREAVNNLLKGLGEGY